MEKITDAVTGRLITLLRSYREPSTPREAVLVSLTNLLDGFSLKQDEKSNIYSSVEEALYGATAQRDEMSRLISKMKTIVEAWGNFFDMFSTTLLKDPIYYALSDEKRILPLKEIKKEISELHKDGILGHLAPFDPIWILGLEDKVHEYHVRILQLEKQSRTGIIKKDEAELLFAELTNYKLGCSDTSPRSLLFSLVGLTRDTYLTSLPHSLEKIKTGIESVISTIYPEDAHYIKVEIPPINPGLKNIFGLSNILRFHPRKGCIKNEILVTNIWIYATEEKTVNGDSVLPPMQDKSQRYPLQVIFPD